MHQIEKIQRSGGNFPIIYRIMFLIRPWLKEQISENVAGWFKKTFSSLNVNEEEI